MNEACRVGRNRKWWAKAQVTANKRKRRVSVVQHGPSGIIYHILVKPQF